MMEQERCVRYGREVGYCVHRSRSLLVSLNLVGTLVDRLRLEWGRCTHGGVRDAECGDSVEIFVTFGTPISLTAPLDAVIYPFEDIGIDTPFLADRPASECLHP